MPWLDMQATAEFAPREENGTTAEAEGEADAILQTALDAQRPVVPPQMWHASPGMVPVGSASPGEGAPSAEAGATAAGGTTTCAEQAVSRSEMPIVIESWIDV